MNERDYPHTVDPALPSAGFRWKSDNMLVSHLKRGIELRGGRAHHGWTILFGSASQIVAEVPSVAIGQLYSITSSAMASSVAGT